MESGTLSIACITKEDTCKATCPQGPYPHSGGGGGDLINSAIYSNIYTNFTKYNK